jgi:branched-chain amino acid transport system substrate-binding protein
LVAAVVAVLGVAACGDSSGGSGGGGGSTEEVVIGMIDDFTGPGATTGLDNKDGATAFVEAINEEGGVNGRTIKLVTYDNKGDAAQTTTLVTRLATQDQASVILCCSTSTATLAAAPVAGRLRVPMLTSAVLQTLTADDQPQYGYLYRAIPDNNTLAQFNIDFIESKGWTRVALDTTTLSYGTNAIPYFEEALAEIGATIVVQTALDPAITDASVQAAQIAAAKPDVVLTWDYPVPTAQLVKALNASGSEIPVVSNWSAINPVMQTIAGTTLPNLFAHDAMVETKPEVKTYIEQWEAVNDRDAPLTTSSMTGYVEAQIAAAAIEAAESTDAAGIKEALTGLDCAATAMGPDDSCVTYGEDNYEGAGDLSFLVMKTLQDGKWVLAE